MNFLRRTIVVPAALTSLAQELAASLSPAGAGMFTVALAPVNEDAVESNEEGRPRGGRKAPTVNNNEITHYVSSGFLEDTFVTLIADADALHAAISQAGSEVTLEKCQDLVANSIVSEEDALVVFKELGLEIVG